jgi:hypothetical protein
MNKIGSLGVGVQSSAMYFMSSLGLLPKLDLCIFSDTGGEKTKTLEYFDFMKNWEQENTGIPILKANYKNIQTDLLNPEKTTFRAIPAFVINKEGEKAMLTRQCTGEYKIQQFNKKYREFLNLGNKNFPQSEVWLGITAEERGRMAVPKEKWKINVYPFCGYKVYPDGHNERFPGFIKTRDGVTSWLINNNLPIPEKSSCKFCPFQGDKSWKRLKDISPEDFEDACKVDDFIRNSQNKGITCDCYVHHSLKPLRSINFSKIRKGFFDDLGNCSDNCNT